MDDLSVEPPPPPTIKESKNEDANQQLNHSIENLQKRISNFEHRLDSEIDELKAKLVISKPEILSDESGNLLEDSESENVMSADQNIDVSNVTVDQLDDDKIIIDNVTKPINQWIEIYNKADVYTKIKLSKNISLRSHLTNQIPLS